MEKTFFIGGILLLVLWLAVPQFVCAQNNIALTITPPLIKNNISPGQVWKSAIKVVNNNTAPLDIYLQVMDFTGGSESGTVNFLSNLPEENQGSEYLLSRWINIDPGPITLGPNESKEIPFIVDVPQNATAGGHYAAILAGTKPPIGELSGSSIKVSSLISSLLLLTIKGEVNEEGGIRDFSTEDYINKKADINFEVKFENSGNVHLQPQGEIRVFDMFGKDQGRMTLNHQSEFGNVLPNETRKWSFNWKGDDSFWSMGRYRASLVIGFGDQAYQTDTRELYFWVLDFVLLAFVAGSFIFVIILIGLAIRFYVRRAIRLTQSQVESLGLPQKENNRLRIQTNGVVTKIVDLKQAPQKIINKEVELSPKKFSLWRSLLKLFIWLFVIIVIIFSAVFFLDWRQGSDIKNNNGVEKEIADKEEASIPDKKDETDVAEPERTERQSEISTSTISDNQDGGKKEEAVPKKDIRIVVLNGSGQPGVAGRAKASLENRGFAVERLGNADNFQYEKTVVRHKKNMENFAKEISGILKVEAEFEENNLLEEEILVVLGADY